MERYIEKLRSYLTEQKPPDESPQSILNMLYEAYNEIHLMAMTRSSRISTGCTS